MELGPIHKLCVALTILIVSFISYNTALVSASNGYPEKIQIIALEAKDGRDFIDPQRICDVCGMGAQRFFLSAIINNNSSEPLPFVTIMEIRDKDGVTQYLQFQQGKLDSNATSNVAISWDPTRAGEFEFRSFVISDFNQPEVLSNVQSTPVKVS